MKKYDFIYFMGDSYTFGASQADDLKGEVTMDNRYSQLVANKFKLPLVNNSFAGCSNDYIVRKITRDTLEYKKKGYKPLVVVCYTDFNRREIWWNKVNGPITLNPDIKIYKDYLVDHYNKEFNKEITRYHMASMKSLLNYVEYDFIETWSGEVVYEPLLDRTTELIPQFIDIVGDDGCFLVTNDYGGKRKGHLNIKGNKIIAKHIIDKIVELYG